MLCTNLLFTTFVMFCIDIVVKYCISGKTERFNQVRWFILHSIVNICICCFTIPGILAFMKDPYNAFIMKGDDYGLTSPTSKWPLILACSVHLYHIIGGFNISWQDIFHHILFLPTLCFTGVYYQWGCFSHWLCFFICGLPGAVDYAILALQRLHMCTWINQKHVCCQLNLFMRGPGILIGIGIAIIPFMQGRYLVPTWALALQFVFMPFNAVFYMKQSTENYMLHLLKTK